MYVLFIVGDLTGKYVIEVGPGPGGITRACLAANAKQVLVIEKDPRFIPSLKLLQEASGGPDRLRINIGDCLHYNVESKMLLISILCILIRPVLK
jgi:16S rRNA A1518/A1519 N6-dimethyltransferase RsmA/KsgA/DIM1 with predicted DNA glycosylase/AP lyase activity